MTVYCHGDCHVWLGSSSLCTCEVYRVAMYGLPQNYNPFLPHTPQPTDLPTVPQARLSAATDAGATHLSGDGLKCYRDDRGGIEVAFWNDETGKFPSWWGYPKGLPVDAVKM